MAREPQGQLSKLGLSFVLTRGPPQKHGAFFFRQPTLQVPFHLPDESQVQLALVTSVLLSLFKDPCFRVPCGRSPGSVTAARL